MKVMEMVMMMMMMMIPMKSSSMAMAMAMISPLREKEFPQQISACRRAWLLHSLSPSGYFRLLLKYEFLGIFLELLIFRNMVSLTVLFPTES
jgi:hypothetical protein